MARTRSEVLFETYCRRNGVSYLPIAVRIIVQPAESRRAHARTAIVEVRQFVMGEKQPREFQEWRVA